MRKRLIALVLMVLTAALSLGFTSAQDAPVNNGKMAGISPNIATNTASTKERVILRMRVLLISIAFDCEDVLGGMRE